MDSYFLPQTHYEIVKFRFMYDVIIEKYLSYRDTLALLYAIPRIHTYMNKHILNPEWIIKREFAKFNISYENFISKFQQNKNINGNIFSIVFGGIMLGIIRSNIYEESDLDFIHYQTKPGSSNCFPVSEVVINTGPNSRSENQDRRYTRNMQGVNSCFRFSYPLMLIKTEGTSADGRMYQHNTILYETASISEYLDKDIDLELTKIYYDGKKIRIKNIDLIFNEKEYVNVNKIFKKDYELYLKINGEKNGERIWEDENYEFILNRIHNRIRKYRKRKFEMIYDENELKIPKILKKISDKYHLICDSNYLNDIYQERLKKYKSMPNYDLQLQLNWDITALRDIFEKYLKHSDKMRSDEERNRYKINAYNLSVYDKIMKKMEIMSLFLGHANSKDRNKMFKTHTFEKFLDSLNCSHILSAFYADNFD